MKKMELPLDEELQAIDRSRERKKLTSSGIRPLICYLIPSGQIQTYTYEQH